MKPRARAIPRLLRAACGFAIPAALTLAAALATPATFPDPDHPHPDDLIPVANPAQRFITVDVTLDSRQQPLAAYQFELTASLPGGRARIVGVEGGEHALMTDPPFVDPIIQQQGAERVIVAWFNTAEADDLPVGKHRIATIHLMLEGDAAPNFTTELTVAATAGGQRIDADLSVQQGPSP